MEDGALPAVRCLSHTMSHRQDSAYACDVSHYPFLERSDLGLPCSDIRIDRDGG